MSVGFTNLGSIGQYHVDQNGIVRAPGRYHLQSADCLYWHDMALDGDGELVYGPHGQTVGVRFTVRPDDLEYIQHDGGAPVALLTYGPGQNVSLQYVYDADTDPDPAPDDDDDDPQNVMVDAVWKLHKMGHPQAYVEEMGGGIYAIIIPDGPYTYVAGTADIVWGMDVCSTRTSEYLRSVSMAHVPSDTTDTSLIATAIAMGIRRRDQR